MKLFIQTKNYYGLDNSGYWDEDSRRAYEIVIRYKQDLSDPYENEFLKNEPSKYRKTLTHKSKTDQFLYESFFFNIHRVAQQGTPIEDHDQPLPEILPFIFTSNPYLLAKVITIPRLLILLLTLFFVLGFHLNQPYKHYPLQQFLIFINCFYLLLGLIPIFNIHHIWVNSGILVAMLIGLCVSLQFLSYTKRKKLGFWSNIMIFFEIFLSMCDLFDSKIMVVALELAIFSILVMIGALMISLRNYKKYNRSTITASKFKKELFMEVLVSAMLTLKIVSLTVKAKEPFRIPTYIGYLIHLPSFYNTEQQVVIVIKSLVFMCLFFFFRMAIVLYRRRVKASHREDVYFDDDRLYTSNIFNTTSSLLEGDDFLDTYGDGIPKTVTDTRAPKFKNNLASKVNKKKKKKKELKSDITQDYRESTGGRASSGHEASYKSGFMN